MRARHNAFRRETDRIAKDLEAAGIAGLNENPRTTPVGHNSSSPVPLTAAGEMVRKSQATLLRRLVMPWQIRAFGYYDLVPELKYAAQFYSRALGNLELFAAERNDKGEIVPTKNKDVIAALDRIKDPGGIGRQGLLNDYGRLMFLVGEALMFVSKNPDTDLEQWEMLSSDELRLMDGNYTRFKAPVLNAQTFIPAPEDAFEPVDDKSAIAFRLWKRHPRYSQLPDSPVEGVLDILEELVLLTQAVRARARSRLANSGLLFIDQRITTRPDEPTPDEDIDEDPFLADLTESMTLPITDEGTASAVVPLIARVSVPDGMSLQDLVYHLQIIDPMQLYPETGLRQECQRRLAIGLDMPPEQLLGMGDVNHWQAWAIDEQSWKYHLQPIADHLVSDLTSAYLSLYLRDKLKLSDWQKYLIAYDASKVINHPDRSKDFKDAHDRGVVGDTAYRDAIGATEDEAPTKEELARIIGMAVRDASLAWYGEPSPRAGGVEVAPGEIVQPGQPTTTPPGGEAGAGKGAEVEEGPPPGGPPRGEETQTAALVTGGATLGLFRAREVAGAKLRTACRRDRELTALIDGKPARDVPTILGASRVRALMGPSPERKLVEGARPLIDDGLRVFGITDDAARAAITETIEAHAIRTLYDDSVTLPPTFTTYVTGVLTSLHGNGRRRTIRR